MLLLVVISTVWAATKLLESAAEKTTRSGTSQNIQLALIEQALVRFVSQNKRLPCPANAFLASDNADWGKELRDASGFCDSINPAISDQKTGIVPWITLGIRQQDVLAADLTYYSYRVFSGPTGLSQNGGADMTHCDLTNIPKPDKPLAASGLCNSDHSNSKAQFLSGKGLTIQKDGATVSTQAAFVLFHHGANQKGAFFPSGDLQAGIRSALPAPTNVAEYGNTLGTNNTTYTATYFANTTNVAVSSDDDSYFDDRLGFLSIDDLIKKAGLDAREWPEELVDASTTSNMTAPSTDPNNPHFMSTGSDASGTSFTASTTGSVTTVSFGTGTGAYAGCLWWPNSIPMSYSTTNYRWNFYTEYSLADYSGDEAPGFTFGFISSSVGSPGNSTCGAQYTGRLGWADGTLSSNGYDGKRFAVEIDTRQNIAAPYNANDPPEVHMAVDLDGTLHDGANAASCATSGYGNNCQRASTNTLLSEDGLFAYHSLRIELTKGCSVNAVTTALSIAPSTTINISYAIDSEKKMIVNGPGIIRVPPTTVTNIVAMVVTLSTPITANVPAGAVIEFQSDSRLMLKAWTLSRDGRIADPSLDIAMKDLSNIFSRDMSGNSEALHVKQCLPGTLTGLEDLYFGITTANYDSGGTGGSNFTFRTLQASRHVAN